MAITLDKISNAFGPLIVLNNFAMTFHAHFSCFVKDIQAHLEISYFNVLAIWIHQFCIIIPLDVIMSSNLFYYQLQ